MQLLVLACEVKVRRIYSVACIKHVSRLIERYRILNYSTIIFNFTICLFQFPIVINGNIHPR